MGISRYSVLRNLIGAIYNVIIFVGITLLLLYTLATFVYNGEFFSALYRDTENHVKFYLLVGALFGLALSQIYNNMEPWDMPPKSKFLNSVRNFLYFAGFFFILELSWRIFIWIFNNMTIVFDQKIFIYFSSIVES